jgi:hypothetical protein
MNSSHSKWWLKLKLCKSMFGSNFVTNYVLKSMFGLNFVTNHELLGNLKRYFELQIGKKHKKEEIGEI